MPRIPGYRTVSEVHRGTELTVWRASSDADGRPVIVKTHTADRPTAAVIAALRYEHGLLSRTSSAFVASQICLHESPGRVAIVCTDVGGESLDRILRSRPLTYLQLLEIARGVARGLRDLHGARLVHCAVNPRHIVLNCRSGAVQLIDLSMGVDVCAHPDAACRLRFSATDIAYLSPEQVARLAGHHTALSLDFRSDLYALGCVLYELATGVPPFDDEDLAELLHAHVAKPPKPPRAHATDLPVALERIILRLLQKAPSHRYQTAAGLDHDLELCQRYLRGALDIPEEFVPGQYDDRTRFRLSAKLYGRERELSALRAALERGSEEGTGVVLIDGVAGIGKTALVDAFKRDPAVARVRVLGGKFEQSSGAKPYSGLVTALSHLVEGMVDSPEALRANWRARLLETCGEGIGALVELLPRLSELVGVRPSPSIPSPTAVANQLRLSLKALIRVFTMDEAPVLLFLDDLQWADPDSRALVADIARDSDLARVSLVCACRTAALGEGQPLSRWLDHLRSSGVPVCRLTLGPLPVEAVSELLADSRIRSDMTADAFAQRIVERCNGNPFDIHRYFTGLHGCGLLTQDRHRPGWVCLASGFDSSSDPRSPGCVLGQQFDALPAGARELLSQAACLGHDIHPEQLALTTDLPLETIEKALWAAVNRGLVRPGWRGSGAQSGESRAPMLAFAFSHDRIQQAAYEAIPAARREAVHLELGRRLLAVMDLASEQGSDYLFVAVAQVNAAEPLVVDPSERLRFARLNVQAALRARRATAFGDALAYLTVGARFLSDCAPSLHRAERARLAYFLSEAHHLVGNADPAYAQAQVALSLATEPLLRSDIFDLLIVRHTLAGEYDEALRVGRRALAELSLEMPAKDAAAAAKIQEKSRAKRILVSDACLPPSPQVAAEVRAALRIMINLLPPTDFAAPDLNHWLASRGVTLSHQRGWTPEYAKMLMNFSNTLIMGDDFQLARDPAEFKLADRLAASALDHASQPGGEYVLPRVLYTLVCYIRHWTRPLKECRELGDRAFRTCQNAGEIQYAGYVLAFHKVMNELFIADTLSEHAGRLEEYARFANGSGNTIAGDVIQAAALPVSAMRDMQAFDANESAGQQLVERAMRADNRKAVCLYFVLRGMVALVHEQPDRALECAKTALRDRRYVSTTLVEVVQRLVFAFALMVRCRTGWQTLGEEAQRSIEDTITRFGCLAELCPSNFLAVWHLLCAEQARLQNRQRDAMDGYEAARDLGGDFGLPPIAALAADLGARFWDELGNSFVANAYLIEARDRYRQFGASRKVTMLDAQLARRGVTAADHEHHGTLSLPELSSSLDRDAMVRTALAVATELRLDDILRELLTLLIQRSGAAEGALLLAQEQGALTVEARGSVQDGSIQIELGSQALAPGSELPVCIVEEVHRRMQPVVLGNALSESPFKRDPWIKARGLRSVLCVPLVQQQSLVGVVYLGNRLTPNAFTRQQIGLIEFLASVAAMSITKAVFVQTLEKKVMTRTAELEKQRGQAERDRAAAISATRAKSALLANVSHELRTPLNAIIGFSDTLNRLHSGRLKPSEVAYLKPREPVYVQEIYDAGQHLLELINEMLDLSRIEAGQVELELAEASIEELVRASLGMVAQRARDSDIELRVERDTGDSTFVCDARRVKQVLINLLSNAVKFTPRGGRVTIRSRIDDDGICLRVLDTGPGIPAHERERIFEPFVRLPHGDREVGGTGLGLSVSREVVQLHGGTLTVEDHPGGGATFTMRLPRVA